MKILYVEDNQLDADLARRALTRYDSALSLTIETSLEATRQCLRDNADYDVLLADLHLPDGSGLDLVGEVREQGLPMAIVVLTSAGDETTVLAALKAGADDYVAKNDGYLDRLPATLESALTRYRQIAQRRPHRLRVLYAEHNDMDVDLTRRYLAQTSPHITVDAVHSTAEIITRLNSFDNGALPYDIVMMDYQLHGLNALEVMKSLREEYALDIPVVLVTGQGNEEIAAQAMRMGAAEYLTKHDGYLAELPLVLENAYHRARLAVEHEALQASEERFRLLAENAQDVIFRVRIVPEQGFEYISPAVTTVTGHSPQDFYENSQLAFELIHPDDVQQFAIVGQANQQADVRTTMRMRRKDGQLIWVEVRSTAVFDENSQMVAIEGIARDITERKRLEQAEHDERMLAEALLDIISAINSTLDLNEVLKRILTNVGRVIPHDGANIMLLDSQTRTMRVVGFCDCYASHGLAEPSLQPHELDRLQSLRQVVEDKQPALIPDVRKAPERMPFAPTEWVRAYLGAPICSDGVIIGLLNLESSKPETFREDDVKRLAAFADQAAIAIRNAQHYHELQAFSESLKDAVEARTAELRHVKERVEAVVNNSPDAILLLDASGLIDIGNPAFFQWFGYDPDAIHGRAVADLAVPAHGADVEAALRSALSGLETKRIEVQARRKNGDEFDVMMALAPIQEMGHLLGIVCSLQDISSLKEIDRMKDAFVSNVSHELRTPITSVRLNQKLMHMNPDRQPIYLERMEREVGRLNDLIEDLLRLSRLDGGRVELDLAAVSLNDLVDEHVEDRSPIAESRSLTLAAQKQEDLPLVEADRGLLGQALSVLLTNALNYTPENGQIVIHTRSMLRDGQTWVGFVVSDTGPGIPPKEIAHLFERFFRGEIGRKSGKSGTGLGLAIAHEIVARHHGEITAEDNVAAGKGTQFAVWLPAKRA